MEKTIAFGYARKSPDDNESTESSISSQVKLIQTTCSKMEWDITDERIYIDKKSSGGDRERPQFGRLLIEIMKFKAQNACDVVLVVKEQDRFARDSSFFIDTLKDLDARQIKVYSVLKGRYLSFEDLGDIVTSVVDAHYIITQKKKSESIFNQKLNIGMPISCPPFGYKMKNKKWVINPKKAEIVVKVINDYKNKVKLSETTKNFKISNGLYYRIVRNYQNGIYSGFVYYERKIRDSKKQVVRIEKVKYQGVHEAIIKD